MKGVYFDYQNHYKIVRVRIDGFRFDGDVETKEVTDKDAGDGRVFTLKCKCGSNNWRDNGRSISEYECDSCGQFVTVSEWRE